jgi:MOSC domain-containing protein YiiM
VIGAVAQISVSGGGIPKLAIPSAELTDVGIAGDGWRYPFHGGRRRAILLITAEGIDELVAQGYPLFAGALGENLTTRGIHRRDLRIGHRLRVGGAEVMLTEMRTPCATLDVYGSGIQAAMFDARVQAGDSESPRWGLSGFYASTVQTGTIRTGDPIAVL